MQYTSAELRDIALELRNLVASVAPDAIEEIRHGSLVYYLGETGDPVCSGICGITIKPNHVRLYFPHGAFIPDPKGLLKAQEKQCALSSLKILTLYPGRISKY